MAADDIGIGTGDNRGQRPRSETWILLLIMAAALAVRVLAALSRSMIQLDETAHVRMAENLAEGLRPLDIAGLSATHFSPLFPLVTSGLGKLTGDFVISAYAVVIIFGTLLLVPAYLLARDLAGGRAGLMTAALVGAMPLFVDYSSRLYSESVYVFFLLLALAAGYRMLRDGSRYAWATLAGFSLGLAYLANPSAVFYLVALAALIVAAAVVRRRAWRPVAGRAALFGALFIICAAPYLIFLHSEQGRWTYSGKAPGNIHAAEKDLRHGTLDWEKEMLALDNDSGETKIMTLKDEADPLRALVTQPLQGVKIFARQSYIFYSEELARVFPLWLLPLLGLGLFAAAWDRTRAAGAGYLLLMMAPALFILTMYAHSRFFMPFVPLAAIWTAQGWISFEEWSRGTVLVCLPEARRRQAARLAPWLVGAAMMLPLLVLSAATVLKPGYPTHYRDAGELLLKEAGRGQRIMSREYSAAYYAGGTAVQLPYAGYNEITAYAKGNEVDFLVIGRQAIFDWRPQLAALLEDDAAHPEWQQVAVISEGTDRETLIFRLRP